MWSLEFLHSDQYLIFAVFLLPVRLEIFVVKPCSATKSKVKGDAIIEG